MKGPPKMLKVSDVPNYLMGKYRLEVTRQTVYNWMNRGIRNDTLQFTQVKGKPTAAFPDVRVTTQEWVDEFLRRGGIELTVVGSVDAGAGQAGRDPGQRP